MERYTLFSSRTRPDLDSSRARSRFALLDLGRATASLGLQPVSNSSTETSRARGKEREERRGALSFAEGTYGHLAAQWREFKSASRYASHSLA